MIKTCTLEQAKRLKELGVEQRAEWCWYLHPALGCQLIKQYPVPQDAYAAFDTDELLDMLPDAWLISPNRGKYRLYNPIGEFSGYSGATPASALADGIIDMCQCSNKGFSVSEINERIRKYNNA